MEVKIPNLVYWNEEFGCVVSTEQMVDLMESCHLELIFSDESNKVVSLTPVDADGQHVGFVGSLSLSVVGICRYVVHLSGKSVAGEEVTMDLSAADQLITVEPLVVIRWCETLAFPILLSTWYDFTLAYGDSSRQLLLEDIDCSFEGPEVVPLEDAVDRLHLSEGSPIPCQFFFRFNAVGPYKLHLFYHNRELPEAPFLLNVAEQEKMVEVENESENELEKDEIDLLDVNLSDVEIDDMSENELNDEQHDELNEEELNSIVKDFGGVESLHDIVEDSEKRVSSGVENHESHDFLKWNFEGPLEYEPGKLISCTFSSSVTTTNNNNNNNNNDILVISEEDFVKRYLDGCKFHCRLLAMEPQEFAIPDVFVSYVVVDEIPQLQMSFFPTRIPGGNDFDWILELTFDGVPHFFYRHHLQLTNSKMTHLLLKRLHSSEDFIPSKKLKITT